MSIPALSLYGWESHCPPPLPVSIDWTVNEDKCEAAVNESSGLTGSSRGGRENVERAPPRDWPRIRNFLACVFLPQVKWIVPISSVRGQLHYVKETLTLNVTECRTLAQRVKHPAGEASLTITIHDNNLLSGAKEAGIMMHSLPDRPRHRALFSPAGWVVKEGSCSHISGLKILFGPCTHPLCSDMSLLSPCFLSVYTGIWIRNKDPALGRSETPFSFSFLKHEHDTVSPGEAVLDQRDTVTVFFPSAIQTALPGKECGLLGLLWQMC